MLSYSVGGYSAATPDSNPPVNMCVCVYAHQDYSVTVMGINSNAVTRSEVQHHLEQVRCMVVLTVPTMMMLMG
jgi:hypothetical protein